MVNFKDIEVVGGHGKGMKIDIQTDTGKVVTAFPSTPGYGYRIGDVLELDVSIPHKVDIERILNHSGHVSAGSKNNSDKSKS